MKGYPMRTSPPDSLDAAQVGTTVFIGEVWEHNLGMSPYGTLAMALEGADYVEILAHYGGLTPEDVGVHLPDEVVVGRPRLGPWLGDLHRIRPMCGGRRDRRCRAKIGRGPVR